MSTSQASQELVASVRRELATRADPVRAEGMRRYAKSTLPCWGVAAGPMREACRAAFAAFPLDGFVAWRDTILALWHGAEHREERYAAIELAEWRPYRRFATALETLPLYEAMIVTGAWWDLVDGIASHRLGDLLRRHPTEMKAAMRAWARGDDLWRRRGAIICQLTCKADTDVELLADCIAPSLSRTEFFLRKAIGWALRQHARTDPAWVRAYVREHEGELSALSKREALRHIGCPA
jgi:3-methyladenine DNA glycosylase AlkD